MLFLLSLVNFAAIAFVTIIAARRSSVDKAHHRLFWMLFFSALWVLSLVLESYDITGVRGINSFATFADFTIAPIIAGFMTLFAFHFPKRNQQLSLLREFLIFIPLISLSTLSVFGVVARPSSYSTDIQYFFPQYPIYISILIIYFLPISAGVLFGKLRKSHGLRKLQLRYVLIGYLFSVSAGLISSILGAAARNFSLALPLAGSTPIVFGVFTTYAMLRYRFLDVKLALRRGLVHTIVFGSIIAILTLLVLGIWQYAQPSLNNQFAFIAAFIILIGFVFEPLRRIVIRWTNRVFFAKEYERRSVARSFRDTSAVSVEEFEQRVVSSVAKYLDDARAQLLIRSNNHWTAANSGEINVGFLPTDLIDIELERNVLVREEIELILEDRIGDNEILAKLRTALKQHDVSVVVPIRGSSEQVIGAILIGPKKSREAFTLEDLNFLRSLGRGTGMVLANVRMYQNIIQRLERENAREIKPFSRKI